MSTEILLTMNLQVGWRGLIERQGAFGASRAQNPNTEGLVGH